jgi:hypothetical protein
MLKHVFTISALALASLLPLQAAAENTAEVKVISMTVTVAGDYLVGFSEPMCNADSARGLDTNLLFIKADQPIAAQLKDMAMAALLSGRNTTVTTTKVNNGGGPGHPCRIVTMSIRP